VTNQALPTGELEHLVSESAMLGGLEPEARALVCAHLELRVVPGGTVLMNQGDPADSLYLIAVGRLRVTMTRDDGSNVVVAELGRGELVGELALLTDERRSATVTALRDSQVYELTAQSFADLVARHPAAFRQVASRIVERLVRTLRHETPTSPVVTIAVVPLSGDPAATTFARRLHVSLQQLYDTCRVVTVDEAAAALGDLERAGPDRVAASFGGQEAGIDAVVYEASPESDEWTAACVRQADLVLLVAASGEDPHPRPVERAIDAKRSRVRIRTELVLVHPEWTRDPRRTRRWLEPREIDRHHHVRVGRDADVDRVARLIVGRGIGLVFSGGGARGVAGIGVLEALAARDVPIDACGGTSIGALMAWFAARCTPPEEIVRQLRAAVVDSSPFDVTFPALSLAAGRRVTESIQQGADGLDVEDTWRNLFCVSTNLTTGHLEVHREGPAWHAVRASFSIPGVFPPVRNATGDLLVDGGLLDNLPVGIMRGEHDGITVLAVDVSRTRDLVAGALPADGVVSGWRLLVSRLDPNIRSGDTAGLGRVLMRLTELGSERGNDRGDVYIRPEIDGYSVGDFKAFDRLLELGRPAGLRAVDEWLHSLPRPRRRDSLREHALPRRARAARSVPGARRRRSRAAPSRRRRRRLRRPPQLRTSSLRPRTSPGKQRA
jgi:predicted acylesterase/phospholipase RssA/CRP-like cAMP-binding protein